MTKVLVIGGSGFLGSHVADVLTEAGHAVRIFDRQDSKHLQESQEMIRGDIMNADDLIDAAKGCSAVYNFAGLADIEMARDRPLETANINVIGNLNAMEAALQAKAKRFVFASSVYVFSGAGSFYRASKQSAEQFTEAYHERYGLDFTIVRYGSLYGRRADAGNFIFKILSQALTENTIDYRGDPRRLREYIHVTDAARLSVDILRDEYANRHLILTGNETLRIEDLILMIREMLPNEIEVTTTLDRGSSHYVVTPYKFHPKIGHKLVSRDFVDLGQGLLDCMAEIQESIGSRTNEVPPGDDEEGNT